MARNTSIALLIVLLTAILAHAEVPLKSKTELRAPTLESEKPKKGLTDIQGTWNFVYYEEKGIEQEPGTRQFAISEDRLAFRTSGVTKVETTIEVDAAQSPKHFTQHFADGQVYRSIFTRVGNLLILCGIRDGGRPAEFSCGTDAGGEFLIVLKRQ